MRDMKKLFSRNAATTGIEVLGGILVVAGVGSFSVPIGVILLGVLLILIGGLSA